MSNNNNHNNNKNKYLSVRCNEIVNFFNKNYKTTLKSSNCLSNKDVNLNYIYIKLPKVKKHKIDLGDFPIVNGLLGYIFINIKNNIKIDATFNKPIFEILWIILDIINQSFDKFKNKQIIYNNIKVFTDVVNYIQFGNYTFIIPDLKKQFHFKVKGYDLAKLTIKNIK